MNIAIIDWEGLGGSKAIWGGPGSSREIWGGPGSSTGLDGAAHTKDFLLEKPKKPKKTKRT